MTLRGAVDQVCNSMLTGGSWSSSSTASTASALDISSASFTRIGSSATVTLSSGSVLACSLFGGNASFQQAGADKPFPVAPPAEDCPRSSVELPRH